MLQEDMNILVPEKLRELENEHNIIILHAAESGSRAWGFFSPDSDFDVRFIYMHKNFHEYLYLNRTRDVIELPVNDTWDVSGWDIDKALRLLYKSNPALYEWLNSPVCYIKTEFADRIKPLLDEYFVPERMIYHYLNTALNNIKKFMHAERVIAKKYFYMLRPVLACFWVMEYKAVPPVLFSELCDKLLPGELRSPLDDLLNMKINMPERNEIKHVLEIENFLNESVEVIHDYLEKLPEDKNKKTQLGRSELILYL